MKVLRSSGGKLALPIRFKEVSDSIPWREAFSEYSDDQLPGACLAGARQKEGLIQIKLHAVTWSFGSAQSHELYKHNRDGRIRGLTRHSKSLAYFYQPIVSCWMYKLCLGFKSLIALQVLPAARDDWILSWNTFHPRACHPSSHCFVTQRIKAIKIWRIFLTLISGR